MGAKKSEKHVEEMSVENVTSKKVDRESPKQFGKSRVR